MQKSNIGSFVRTETRHISDSYGSIVQLFDSGDTEAAMMVLHRVLIRFSKLIEVLRTNNEQTKTYIDMVIANQLPEFSADFEFLQSLETKSVLTDSNLKHFSAVMDRFEDYIDVLKTEARHIFPGEFGVLAFLRRTWGLLKRPFKFIFLPLGALVAICLVVHHVYVLKHSFNGEFFDDITLSHSVRRTHDQNINFEWDYGSPFRGFKVDQFSARWTAFLKIERQGNYQFQTESDDGVILWIDDTKVIQNWTNHSVQKNLGTVFLMPGYHRIRLDYYEFNANAEIGLLWKPELQFDFSEIPGRLIFSDEKYFRR